MVVALAWSPHVAQWRAEALIAPCARLTVAVPDPYTGLPYTHRRLTNKSSRIVQSHTATSIRTPGSSTAFVSLDQGSTLVVIADQRSTILDALARDARTRSELARAHRRTDAR